MELIQVRIQVNPKGFLSQVEKEDVAVTQPSCEQTTHVAAAQLDVPEYNSECSQTTESASTQQSQAKSKSEQRFKASKIYKTYIDFKKTLSEGESENFFKFVKEAIKDFQQPIQDIEAWLASKTKAGQNRWEVYYQKYQSSQKVRKLKPESNSVSESIKQNAIAKYQKQLNQEQNGYRKISHEISTSEFNRLLDNPDNQIKRISKLESQSQPISKPLGKYVSKGCEHLRNLRMKSLFASESIKGGMA